MAVKKVKPISNARRNYSKYTFEELTKGKSPEKRLLTKKKEKAGRNSQGKLTVRHRGGGHKKRLRKVDFSRIAKLNIEGTVTSIEYDPNRTAYIMLVTYKDGDKRYHLAPEGILEGDKLLCAEKAKIKKGNRLKIKNIPPGFSICNIEMFEGRGGQLCRSAGGGAKLASLEGKMAHIELPSKEVRLVSKECFATIGVVSNIEHSNLKIGKAGRKRWMGKRPQVRGKAMNPCDHPHGGGEGATSIGMKHPKTPWGLPALGFKTRKNKLTNKYRVRDRKGRQVNK
ncbi:MAG: 50S ribosomal protein L2 [Patescibacteria group bacterium]|nr:50S ribosomal protein L2 [Patescibacteria group bacterium]